MFRTNYRVICEFYSCSIFSISKNLSMDLNIITSLQHSCLNCISYNTTVIEQYAIKTNGALTSA